MKVVTASQMQQLDQTAIEKYHIPSLILMENAGRGVAEFIFNLTRTGRVTIVAGKGNNGGDGFVIARHLFNRGFQVLVLLMGDPKDLKTDPETNYRILSEMDVPVTTFGPEVHETDLLEFLAKSDVIVDALFGVGLDREVSGPYKEAISAINREGKNVVAVDIPSGLHADSGEVLGIAVQATHTATLGLPKKGLLEGNGPEYAGKVCVVDIGLPRQEIEALQ